MDILRLKRVTFVQGLTSIPSVLDHLISNDVFTMSNKHDIESHRNPEMQARAILDLLVRKGPRVLEGFYKALVETDNGPLAELLEAAVTKTSVQEENRPQPIQPKPKPGKQEKHCQLLVLEGEDVLEGFKEKNDIFTIENCTKIMEKIKESTKNSDLEKFAVFILDSFDGNAVESMTSSVSISEIYSTLIQKMPGKETICVLLHSEDTKKSPVPPEKDPIDSSCRLAALSKDRLKSFLKEDFESKDQCFSSLTKFINLNEIIWPLVKGCIYLLDGLEDNKEIGDFLCKENTRMNFEYVSRKCSDIESKLKDAPVVENAKYFIVFLLGQFNGKNVQDISNENNGVHITKICVAMKEIWPKIRKICVLFQADDVKPEKVVGLERGDESVLIVSLTKQRLSELMKKMKNSDINSCIENFVKEEEIIW